MTLDFTHRTGNTFDEVPFELKLNGVAIDLTGTSIAMVLVKELGGAPQLTLSNGSGLTITSAIAGQFKINQQIISIDPFAYFYDIIFTFPGGVVKTYLSGQFIITY